IAPIRDILATSGGASTIPSKRLPVHPAQKRAEESPARKPRVRAHFGCHSSAEEVRPRPKNIYGITKRAAEDLCELFYRRFGLPWRGPTPPPPTLVDDSFHHTS